MNVGDVAKRAGVVTGVAAGLVGAAYAGERAIAARIRRGGSDEGVADDPLAPDFDFAARIDCHDAGSLHVISRGTGSVPIVFAHGVTLSSRCGHVSSCRSPPPGFQAVAFDGRGHGESTVGDTGHSIENLAEDLKSVLTALELHDAILVGHSMGGMAVQALAIQHPDVVAERVRGLVLLSTSPRMMTSDAHRTRSLLERVAGVVPDVGTLMRQRNLGLLLARVGFGDDPDPRSVEATRQMLGACSRETMRDAARALLELDLTRDLPAIDVPTLVVVGSADVLTPPRDARQIADLIPGAVFVEMPRAGHMLMYERTEELDRLVIDFARQCLDEGRALRSAAR